MLGPTGPGSRSLPPYRRKVVLSTRLALYASTPCLFSMVPLFPVTRFQPGP